MPIGDERRDPERYRHYRTVFEELIRASVERVGKLLGIVVQCTRADDIQKSGAIMRQVLADIGRADIVIADLSDQNPNVFYELGVRHALRKRSILISSDPGSSPFDVSGHRAIPYKFPNSEIDRFQRDLQGFIKDILDNPRQADSPVWEYDLATPVDYDIDVEIARRNIKIEGHRHDYEFQFGISNIGDRSLGNVMVELYFPLPYLERQEWRYKHLDAKEISLDGREYFLFHFNYQGIPERYRLSKCDACLLPGRTLWVFGGDPPITQLPYYVDNKNWGMRFDYEVSWKIFVSGKLCKEGRKPFDDLQKF